ncbi:Cytochrome P450 6j1 [Cryptotermes secundus]|uniref:Cytochrome P450 6j1 n=1 Tax=Cryptotermes secundus TaxID=105785 RepID=A0A2J7PXN4_9NEOP|nr:Cytochrome P450 6j1 [Cryptotermes secundus]
MALLLEWPTLVLTIFSAVFIGFYFYFTRNFNFWKNLGVPYVKPSPFVGNLKECVLLKETIGNHLKNLYDEHSDKPYVGIFSFDKPSLLVRDPKLLKNILVKDSKFFADHIMSVDVKSDPVFGNSLFVLKGQRWREVRVNMTPIFTSGRMKNMFYLVVLGCKELIELLDKETAKGSPVQVKETMTRYTTDVIASCAFGIQSNTLKNPYSEFRDHLREVFDFTVRKGLTNLLAFFAPSLKSILRLKLLDNSTADYIRKLIWSTVEYREKTGLIRKDILHWINELRTNGKKTVQDATVSAENPRIDSKFQLDDDEFVAQAFQILAGGFETSGTTMSFALYELALHPDIQHRLREEITRVMAKHQGELTYEGMQEMSYLDMVVSETLRKYPVLPFLDRMCGSDYTLPSTSGNGTVLLPKGTGVFIPVFALHYDPQYYPDPDKFDPERFTEENKQNRPNYTYLPFGEGPRICIGMRFGFMQVKAGLIHILSRFEVSPCKDTPLAIVFDTKSILLKMDGEIPMSFSRIHL